MTLQNFKAFPTPIKMPINFQGKVTILTNCDVTEDEVTLFNASIKAMSEYLSDNNIDLSTHCKFNVLFTYDGTFSFFEENNTNCGSQLQFAIYRMNKLRQLKSYKLTMFVYIEELAHYFLRIYDETAIKYKVEDVMKYILPDFKLDDVKGWGLNGLQ